MGEPTPQRSPVGSTEREVLLDVQRALSEEQFQTFKYLLEERLPLSRLQAATRPELCTMLLQHFPGRALHVAAAVLRRLARNDLILRYRLPGEDAAAAGPGEVGAAKDALGGAADALGAVQKARWRPSVAPGMPSAALGSLLVARGLPAVPPQVAVGGPRVVRGGSQEAGGPRDAVGGPPDAATDPPGCGEDSAGGGGGRGGAPHPPLTSPWVSPGGGRLLSERDLLRVAQLLGHEWQEVGVLCLGLQRCRLEQIRENNPHRTALCSFEMLREWRRREGAAATAPRLRDCLSPAQLDPEVFALLQQL